MNTRLPPVTVIDHSYCHSDCFQLIVAPVRREHHNHYSICFGLPWSGSYARRSVTGGRNYLSVTGLPLGIDGESLRCTVDGARIVDFDRTLPR